MYTIYEAKTKSKIVQLGKGAWLNRSVNRDQTAVEIVIFQSFTTL